MIVCSCNVLSDNQIRDAVAQAAPRSPLQVYDCLGCSPRCGRCMRTIRTIMDEALGGCPAACGGRSQD
jgi:bacterioferritin-associated ferredoxin